MECRRTIVEEFGYMTAEPSKIKYRFSGMDGNRQISFTVIAELIPDLDMDEGRMVDRSAWSYELRAGSWAVNYLMKSLSRQRLLEIMSEDLETDYWEDAICKEGIKLIEATV